MNDMTGAAAAPVAAPSAGRLLREARERQGLHIAALAASIKVTQKKLELLEADRFDALPDATFARALALTVCRALKIDSAAVLRLLPPAGGHRLEQVGEGLNAPFRERPGVLVQREGTAMSFGWIFWLTTLILIAAAVVYFLPSGLLSRVAARTVTGAPPVTGAVVVHEAPVTPVPAPAAAPSDSDIFPPGVTAPPPPAESMPAETNALPPAPATSNGGSGR
jgi:cytoskeleton protein RodZ